MKELRPSLTKNSNQRSRRTSFCSDEPPPHMNSHYYGLSIINTIRTAELVLVTTLGLITVLLILRGQPPHHMHRHHSHHSSLDVGSIVELYEDASYFAIPAIITDEIMTSSSSSSSASTSPPSPREDDNTNEDEPTPKKIYSLTNVITNIPISSIPSNYIHPYQPYEDGTMASCNIAALRKVQMKPCAIVSHSTRESGLVTYQVSYLNKDNVLIHETLPFSRVQRRRHVEDIEMVWLLMDEYDMGLYISVVYLVLWRCRAKRVRGETYT